MGNSPSKNDLLPNTSNVTSAGVGTAISSNDIEAEESNLSALSRPTGNGSSLITENSRSQPKSSSPQIFSHYTFREHSKNGVTPAPEVGNVPNVQEMPEVAAPLVSSAGLNPRAIPTAGPSSNSSGACSGGSYSCRSMDYGAQIDLSMARLVVTDRSMTVPGVELDLGSSLDTQRSDNLSVSPVFTLCDKYESLVSSLYSLNNLPTLQKGTGAQGPAALPPESNLAPIVEVMSELTPEPVANESRASACSLASVASVTAGVFPKSVLKKEGRKFSSNGSKSGADSSMVSSSPLLSSPLAPNAVKLDFDVDDIIDRLVKAGKRGITGKHKDRRSKDKLPVAASEIKLILARARLIFMEQPTLLQLLPPVKIVGDIHGQFYDLIRIFNSCGHPPRTNYLFLGDYVDRGYKSLELILLLLCYKIKYPENFFMLRGNHESANITKIYGFYDECKRRLPAVSGSHKMWKNFVDVFNTLPIAATINDKVFCIHGGLSPELTSLKQIQQIQRPTDIPDRGLLADLLWSDPDPLVRTNSPHVWPKNDRGVSYCFGKKHVNHFLSMFNMDLIVRGHMVVEDGYQFFNKRKLVTVFLAPNYCGEFKNYGAVMSVDRSLCCLFELIKP